ncbi:MAG: hypothetical protein HC853_14760 [Anaerolineae bacterium]|nr:hypothetical protein [Anaerolineae bacterium]
MSISTKPVSEPADESRRAIAGVTSGLIGLGQEVTWRARHFGIWQSLTVRITEFQRQKEATPKRPIRLLIVAGIFFGLSVAALLLPLNFLPRTVMLLSIGFDVFLLGLGIARLDAFDEGEALWRDLLRSFIGAALVSAVFGVLMGLAAGSDVLLYLALATAISTQTFSDALQALIDKLAFARQPQLQLAREELREVSAALPRMPALFDPNAIDEAEFVKLTRRALGHFGDLTKLTTSPLTHLPVVQKRLNDVAEDTPLVRANLLKGVLSECIVHLKPDTPNGFGTSDEWRHYNALYFPYVVGLKPYSVRAEHDSLPAEAKAALEWFRSAVPERTLHNWQNAAAKLVAQQIKTI